MYVLIGTVAKYNAGPSLPISFLVAGAAAALSAFCYAELSSRCPSAGSAYHYAYTTVGEMYVRIFQQYKECKRRAFFLVQTTNLSLNS